MNSFLKLIVIGLSLTVLTACLPSAEHDHPQLRSRDALYEYHCVGCHGKDGRGGTVSLAEANFLEKRMTHAAMINYLLRNNNPDRKMPVFDTMLRSEAMLIIDQVFVLRKQHAGGGKAEWIR